MIQKKNNDKNIDKKPMIKPMITIMIHIVHEYYSLSMSSLFQNFIVSRYVALFISTCPVY